MWFFRYGLLTRKPAARLQAFASDSDSDDTGASRNISIGASNSQKRQAKNIQDDALKEDPTIFQYDEVYDEMTASREEAKKAKKTEVKQVKYINRLLVVAEKRKLEHESRLERKVQKERDAEGDKYKDKEVFVTSAYREKLEALKKAEEEARREEYLEQIGDVRKQSDLSGFYRHFYEQKLGDAAKIEPKPQKSNTAPIKNRSYRKHGDESNSEDDDKGANDEIKSNEKPTSGSKAHIQSNIDADSDFSIDSSDSEDLDEKSNIIQTKLEKSVDSAASDNTTSILQQNISQEASKENVDKTEANDSKTISSKADDIDEMPPPPAPKKPKIDIWEKRTVGDVYQAAVQRYYERKQQLVPV